MKGILAPLRSYGTGVRLLMVNQFAINLGFYMLMPYLAVHLSGTLGMAAWTVGLVLGVRNFSQQGMFLVGGTLADRLGYKPLIVAGLLLRTAGFALLGLVGSLPALLVASAAVGLAGALFNPASRAYLAVEASERRVEAFALFNVFYQAGILLGPPVGMLLTGAGFRVTCLTAAGIFAVLGAVQIRRLPARRADGPAGTGDGPRPPVLAQWRGILANRPFVLFSTAMAGSYVLSYQVYLALPLEVRRLGGPGHFGTAAAAALFAVPGLLTILLQTRVTAWCRARTTSGRALVWGLLAMAAAFAPLLLAPALPLPDGGGWRWLHAAGVPVLAAVLLAVGTMVAYPFEMDTLVGLSGDRLVATHYGLYNTVCGIGITVGNLLTGAALDAARAAGVPSLPWLALLALGVLCAGALLALERTGRLAPPGRGAPAEPAAA
ncbi:MULTISPECIES: MFS transporter [Streptomyces]|uniref:MFS transporter n=1 Tax=Streptomyces TaxID=1883 RepID=UPI001996E617|nr:MULTISPECIES: MFS transporter [Streptomyces]GGT19499.1 putative ABC transport system membrane protein [Streptomyces toxytricini]